MRENSRSVLITGATGFLGKRLCQTLFERGGYFVKMLLRSNSRAPDFNRISQVEVVPEPWRLESLRKACQGVGTVVHLAGLAHLLNLADRKKEASFRSVNVDLTRLLLSSAAEAGVTKFLFVSSVLAMASQSHARLKESDECRPVTAYGKSKLAAEAIVQDLSEKWGLSYSILRLPVVYGPGNKANMLRLFWLVDKGMPLPFKGISNLRSFIYLDNAIDAIISVLESSQVSGQTFFVSDGQDVSTAQLLSHIAESLKRPIKLFHVTPWVLRLLGHLLGRTEDIDRLLGSLAVDMTRFQQVVGWTPPYTLEEGLKKTADWYRSR